MSPEFLNIAIQEVQCDTREAETEDFSPLSEAVAPELLASAAENHGVDGQSPRHRVAHVFLYNLTSLESNCGGMFALTEVS